MTLPPLPPQPGLGAEPFAAYAAYLDALEAKLAARTRGWSSRSQAAFLLEVVRDLAALVRDMAERTVK